MRYVMMAILTVLTLISPAMAEQWKIGDVSTVYRMVGSNDKLNVLGIDDPKVDGIVCHWSRPEKGGISGSLGFAEDPSDVSLACRQVGAIKFKDTFAQGENIAKASRNWTGFKTMQVVRFCDTKTNVLVYLVYSDKLIDGSPKNALSTVPIMPWGENKVVSCKDNLK